MKIVVDWPPIIEQIAEVFPEAKLAKGVIFSWGDTIYNPHGIYVNDALRAHESVHGQRQTPDERAILAWWERYMTDLEFRVSEEVLGHRAELAVRWGTIHDRNERSKILNAVAQKLAGPLYGHAISLNEARRRLS